MDDQQAPELPQRTGFLGRLITALKWKWRLEDCNRELTRRLKNAREENDWLREQLDLYRDTAQAIAICEAARGAEAKAVIEALRDRR